MTAKQNSYLGLYSCSKSQSWMRWCFVMYTLSAMLLIESALNFRIGMVLILYSNCYFFMIIGLYCNIYHHLSFSIFFIVYCIYCLWLPIWTLKLMPRLVSCNTWHLWYNANMLYCYAFMFLKHLFSAYRESQYAVSIIAMACASLVQIANSIIQWEVLCMAMLHHQLVRPQLLGVCWHMYHRIQKCHLIVAREGLGGSPILIRSKYLLLKGALRERRPKPSSVSLFMLPPIFLTGVIICKNIWGSEAVQVFCLTFELYIPELASTCIAFRQEKVLACSGCSFGPIQNGNKATLLKHMYGTNSPLDIQTHSSNVPWSRCCSYRGCVSMDKAFAKLTGDAQA